MQADIPRYDPQAIESKWQRIWLERGDFLTREDSKRPKFYLLEMLPYPSGDLHVGHARNYTLGDVIARYLRMRGFNVLHPMGWDAFGLPAENAAIERGISPDIWTETNIANMRRQIQRLGTSYDWSREVDTSSPEYYRWTQWLFLLMYRRGLAYKKEAPVNWCPSCGTVLANEQAEGGVCWRCGSSVERRLLNQWFLRITQYADKLLEGLDRLEGWPERVKTMQRNWIGRSEGVRVKFALEQSAETIEVFTTRPDTIFGVTFLALAAEHPLVARLIAGRPEATAVQSLVESVKDRSELDRTQLMEKQGAASGAFALHPLTKARIPIYVTNYVIATYGGGAVMGVPAHDERDLQFARAYGIDVRTVVAPVDRAARHSVTSAFLDDGVLVDSGEFTGLPSANARVGISEKLRTLAMGGPAIEYKLRDWLISRQRYWGAPIPFVNCPNHGLVPVPESELPVLLPPDAPLQTLGGSPLSRVPSFMETRCPLGDGPATREPETMDTFMCSSWYFLRYLNPHDDQEPWKVAAARRWVPVDRYIGGIEHAVLHLMYARFFYKVLAEEGLVPGHEPFLHLFNQGMVLGAGHEKMSKSRHNTVGIDETADSYGVDALRVFEMFAGPPESDFPWSTTGIAGATRTLARIWRLVLKHAGAVRPAALPAMSNGSAAISKLRYSVHAKIKQVTEELSSRMHLNTCVAALMSLLNDLESFAAEHDHAEAYPEFGEGLDALVLMMAPFAPHLTEELWERIGRRSSVHEQAWPTFDPGVLARSAVLVVIQVNGKRRGSAEFPAGAAEEEVFAGARALPTVAPHLEGKQVMRRVYVQDKLLNIVVS